MPAVLKATASALQCVMTCAADSPSARARAQADGALPDPDEEETPDGDVSERAGDISRNSGATTLAPDSRRRRSTARGNHWVLQIRAKLANEASERDYRRAQALLAHAVARFAPDAAPQVKTVTAQALTDAPLLLRRQRMR
jgi:hypothetical protein